MLFSWWHRRRRRKLLAQPFPESWEAILADLPFYTGLTPARQARLRDVTRVLIDEKDWEGCGGLELTERMLVTIAAQAAVLVLDLETWDYPNVDTILVYPSTYVTHEQRDGAGVVRTGQANLGEAWRGGPVILAWDSVENGVRHGRDGRNLVLHEFAHKLDMLDGLADGTPPLDCTEEFREWVRVMSESYRRLCDAAERGRPTLLDKYGTTNPAEFLAVVTECYFERGERLKERHPELFGIMEGYYHPEGAD